MGDELLNKLTCIADYGQQQNSWYEAGGAGSSVLFLSVLPGQMFGWRSWPWVFLFLAIAVTRERFSATPKRTSSSCGERQQNGPGVERKAVKQAMNWTYANTPVHAGV